MKTGSLDTSLKGLAGGGAVVLLTLAAGLAPGEKVAVDQVPEAVRKAIELQKGPGIVEEIERDTDDGSVVYEVEIRREGKKTEFKIREDGVLLGPGSATRSDSGVTTTSGAGSGKLTLDQVPAAVRRTIEEQLKGGRVEEIDRDVENGRIVYEVEIERGTRDFDLKVAEDGSILPDDDDDDRITTGTAGPAHAPAGSVAAPQ